MPVPDRHDADEGPFDIARDASEFSVHGSGAFLVSVVRHPTLRRAVNASVNLRVRMKPGGYAIKRAYTQRLVAL